MVNDFIISNEKIFSELKEKFILGGFTYLCIISDFVYNFLKNLK